MIDFHTHIFPNRIADTAMKSLSEHSGLAPAYDGTENGLISSMDRAGIEKSVALPIATKEKQVESINSFAISVNQESERILSFGTMHPDYVDYKKELKRLKDNGVLGIKMHPLYQNFYVNDERVFPIYECAEKLGLIVLLHAGMDLGFPGIKKCTPIRCRRIIDRFKKLTLILAHMGGFELWDEVEDYLIGEDVYIDTSFSSHILEAERMKEMIRNHSVEKVLFGTDGPWADQEAEVGRIRQLDLAEDELELIFEGNAKRILGLQ